jgi:oxygen-independent coproporphyrinogen-3 oxidase
MYPPRQAYHAIDSVDIENLIEKSINKFNDLNLYFHIPFCKQICSFCNLYTTVSTNEKQYKEYMELLKIEFAHYTGFLTKKKINTLYVGGGTPSLLSPDLFSNLFQFIEYELGVKIADIEEVAMEVYPDTVTKDKLTQYKAAGFNRINLGFQTTNSVELAGLGRSYKLSALHQTLESAKSVNFKNICVDLIYGLKDQSFQSWQNSLEEVIAYSPQTICIYPLTLRPATIYKAKGYVFTPGNEQYQKYNYAVERLSKAGYKQENHVRYVKDGGGYIQKANHWAMQNLLGIGAGARSYLWYCDTRNGYGAFSRKKALENYVFSIKNNLNPITDGFIMTDDERMRKAVILNIISLNRNWFMRLFECDVVDVFPKEIEVLQDSGFLLVSSDWLSLTAQGIKYRDVIVQVFFSSQVRNLVAKYEYKD